MHKNAKILHKNSPKKIRFWSKKWPNFEGKKHQNFGDKSAPNRRQKYTILMYQKWYISYERRYTKMTKSELLKLVKAKCLDCCCDQPKEVALCPIERCPLYSVRLGKDPNPRKLSEAELEIRKNNLRGGRKSTEKVDSEKDL